ncbi:hypothetical protein K502DRAFT_330705 [Neoconidiobolus thromboides FSU 785]|nr:hypothetical protein K502DRAFT_330705 [Neoconidiobolus thromboides FSU 785]
MLLLLISINFLFYKLNALLPRVDYGGCTIIEDKLYYLCGNTYSPRTDYFLKENHEVFTLNLKKGFKLVVNVAPWERNNTINSPKSQLDPSFFYIGNEEKQKTIVSFHHEPNRLGLITNYFDIESNRWYKNDIVNKLYSKVNVSNINISSAFQRYYVLQDEKDLNQFYISGSFQYNNSKEDTSLQLNSFNIKTKELKTIYKTSKKVYFELKFVLNNKLYYFEMTTKNDHRGLIYADKILYELDLKSNNMKSYNLNNSLMYFDSTFVKVNQLIYFIGLKDMNKRIIDVYEFKFNTFSFKKINKQINPFNHWGCFTSYNNYIINSFGHQFGSITPGTGESTDKMLILDTKTWETTDGLLPLIEEKEESINITNGSNEENNTNYNKNLDNNKLLIGGIIGGISGIILITAVIIFLYKYKMKEERPVSMIIEPILIKPTNPLDINTGYYNAEMFNHYHEIDNNTTMLPLKTCIKSNKDNFT